MCPLERLKTRRQTPKVKAIIREHRRAVALGLQGCTCRPYLVDWF